MAYRTRTSPRSLSIAATLVFIATLFFWLSAFSVPFIKHIFYIHTREDNVRFGNFGYCAGPSGADGLAEWLCYRHVGYQFKPWIPGNTHTTGALMLVALTAGFGTLAFFNLLHTAADLRSGFGSFFLTLLTTLLATISFLLVVIIFGVAHHRFKNDSLNPHYGAAFVLVIIGWLLYLASIPFIIIGWFRERHYRNANTNTAPFTPREISAARA